MKYNFEQPEIADFGSANKSRLSNTVKHFIPQSRLQIVYYINYI